MNTATPTAGSRAGATLPGGGARARTVAPTRPRHPRQLEMERIVMFALRIAQTLFLATGLFLLSHALVPLLLDKLGGGISAYEGNSVLRNTFLMVHAGTFLLLLVHWRRVLETARADWPTLVVVALAVASVAWSAAPDLTLRRAFAVVATTGFGLLLASLHDTRSLLKMLASVFFVIAVASVGIALAFPVLGIHHTSHPGAWRGVYTEKNTLGLMMAMGVIVFLLLRPSLRRRWVASAGGLLCFALLLLSTSKSAVVVLIAVGAMALLFRTFRWHYTATVAFLAGSILVAGSAGVILVANAETVLSSLGRDATLTGRTPIWGALLDVVRDRPLLGHGYSAIWTNDASPASDAIARIGWRTPSAHNGYLEVALQLGVAGLAALFAGMTLTFVRGIRMVRSSRESHVLWPVLFLTLLLIYNVSESLLLDPNTLLWVLYVASASLAARHGRRLPNGTVNDEEPARATEGSEVHPAPV